MKYKRSIQVLTQTGVMTALLVVLQAVAIPLGSTLVTGSIVNLLLILSVMLCGAEPGLAVGAVSPVLAKLFGIGPLWGCIPFIILGNATLVLLWHSIGKCRRLRRLPGYLLALVAAAAAKSAVLYVGIVKLAIPYLFRLPAQQAAVLSGMFSASQLLTAAVGGGIAVLLLPVLHRALHREA